MTWIIIISSIIAIFVICLVFARIDERQRAHESRRDELRRVAAAKQVSPEEESRAEEALARARAAAAARKAKAELERLPWKSSGK